ncbi:hypothetical protein LCGC14_0922090 [marine sediment metagenome]|uniref:Uncharacterized protein n=1 Tax=marine sediment metagenome TaxID=412755 RepID=A0A0F9RX76_9ZZZZ|nr:hypothetical protein [Candidatus Aminicenantes bacterium]HEB35371.1 hypothetical protein [Candidatus Aminicenantes bacterium]
MKKLQNLRLFVLVSILMVALIFVGIILSHPNDKKMNRWELEAVILDTGGNLVGLEERIKSNGEGWAYSDNEENVTSYAVIGRPARTIFRFRIYYPLQIRFQNIIGYDECDFDPDLKCSKFPPDNTSLFEFLNGDHPYDAQYRMVDISFFGPFVDSRDDANWEMMDPGESRSGRAWISMEAHNLHGDCSECDVDDYHSLIMNTYDASIKRGVEDVDSWILSVDTNFDGPNDYMREKYCECVKVEPTKGKRPPRYYKETRYPAWGQGHIEFQIKFKRANM